MQQTLSEQEWQQLQERIDALFGHIPKTYVQMIEYKGPVSVPLLEMHDANFRSRRRFDHGTE